MVPIGKNILFQREFTPALAIKAGMHALSACVCRVEVRNHGNWIESLDASLRHSGESKKTTSMALFQYGCQRPVYFLCRFFVSFIESLCDIKLVVGQGTRTFVFFVYHTWTGEPVPVRGSTEPSYRRVDHRCFQFWKDVSFR